MVRLALESEPVSHSLLAFSAACLCRSMISGGHADPRTIRRVLGVGLQHHVSAIEQMRSITSQPQQYNAEALLANAAMLVPFPFAYQTISYWVQCQSGIHENSISVTPRDSVTLMRGLKTTILALSSKKIGTRANDRSSQSSSPESTTLASPSSDLINLATVSRAHLMFPILAATSERAFLHLQHRTNDILMDTQPNNKNIAFLATAFEILKIVVCDNLWTSGSSADSSIYITDYFITPDSLLAQVPTWLRAFASRDPSSARTEPLHRQFLAFFYCTPQAFLDLLFPLLDQKTEGCEGLPFAKPGISTVELHALDIYAHWLALMFLVEDEAWWLASFPVIALQNLIRKYGDHFGDDLYGQWWPRSMLKIMTELKPWR